MTLEEMERGFQVMQDNMTVQGVMMHRLENNLDRLEAVVAENSAAIAKLGHGMTVMQSAMQRLFDHMDRFIRGLESNGHERQ